MPPTATQTRAGHGTGAPARSPALALLVICAGYFLVILDAMVVNVALPSVGHELHGGVAGLQWTVDAYTLSFAGLLLTGGDHGTVPGARGGYGHGRVRHVDSRARGHRGGHG